MKKNRIMRIASGILVATLLSTCVISGTFAKYVTQDAAEDFGRVAKWGVVLQVTGDLYGTMYDNENHVAAAEDGDKISVKGTYDDATAGTDVVAPGTKSTNDAFTLGLSGKPEVDSRIDYTIKSQNVFLGAGEYAMMVARPGVTAENFAEIAAQSDGGKLYTKASNVYTPATGYTDGGAYFTKEDLVNVDADYFPVVYNCLTSAGTTAADSAAAAAVALATKLQGSAPAAAVVDAKKVSTITGSSATIRNNTDLSTLGLTAAKVTWAWNFSDADPKATAISANDKKDTILGDLMAKRVGTPDYTGEIVLANGDESYTPPVEYTNYCLDTMFSVDVQVTQVD